MSDSRKGVKRPNGGGDGDGDGGGGATAAAAAASSASSAHVPFDFKKHMYRDIIHSVFEFCDIGQLNMAMRVSPQWRHDLSSFKVRNNQNMVTNINTPAALASAAENFDQNNALKRHVTEIDVRRGTRTSMKEMQSIAHSFPRVRKMAVDIELDEDNGNFAAVLPRTLTSLDVYMNGTNWINGGEYINMWFQAVNDCTSLAKLKVILAPGVNHDRYFNAALLRFGAGGVDENRNFFVRDLTIVSKRGPYAPFAIQSPVIPSSVLTYLHTFTTNMQGAKMVISSDDVCEELQSINAPWLMMFSSSGAFRLRAPLLKKLVCRAFLGRRLIAESLESLDIEWFYGLDSFDNVRNLTELSIHDDCCDGIGGTATMADLSLMLSNLVHLRTFRTGCAFMLTESFDYIMTSGLNERLEEWHFHVSLDYNHPLTLQHILPLRMPQLRKLIVYISVCDEYQSSSTVNDRVRAALTPTNEYFMRENFPSLIDVQFIDHTGLSPFDVSTREGANCTE